MEVDRGEGDGFREGKRAERGGDSGDEVGVRKKGGVGLAAETCEDVCAEVLEFNVSN